MLSNPEIDEWLARTRIKSGLSRHTEHAAKATKLLASCRRASQSANQTPVAARSGPGESAETTLLSLALPVAISATTLRQSRELISKVLRLAEALSHHQLEEFY
jgi:hypothetical protein